MTFTHQPTTAVRVPHNPSSWPCLIVDGPVSGPWVCLSVLRRHGEDPWRSGGLREGWPYDDATASLTIPISEWINFSSTMHTGLAAYLIACLGSPLGDLCIQLKP